MAKFVYRMQSILDVKLKMEEQARQAFATAKTKLDEEQAKLEQLQKRKAGYEQRAKELLLQKLDFLEIEANHNAIDRMDEFISLQRQHVERAQEQVEDFEEFKQELNPAESKEIDELTSYTHGRKALAR